MDIFGWMLPEELEWLAFEASRHKRIVEIGCYMGRSTRALGDNAKGIVYAVDHWNGPPEIQPPPHPPETLYPAFEKNLRDLIPHKVKPMRLDSLVAAERFMVSGAASLMFDMVFIDGHHALESVWADIKEWSKLLEPGGLLCGHDAEWAGVRQARQRLLPPHMTGVGGIWALDNFQGLKE